MPRMDCLSKQHIHLFLSASCRTAQHSKMRAVGSLCCHDHYIYFKKGDSKVAELKAAHYNPIWLEMRIMQVKYAEIKMMMQRKKKHSSPPSGVGGRMCLLVVTDFSGVDFKHCIWNLVFSGRSLPALFCKSAALSLASLERYLKVEQI